MNRSLGGGAPLLSDLGICGRYRSGRPTSILDRFYLPCLRASESYDRAVGFFSGSTLSIAAAGFHELVRRGGRVRLVASPQLTQADADAIRDGYDLRKRIEEALVRELDRPGFSDVIAGRLGLIAWMIANGNLDFRIAVVESPHSGIGIYHEKLGIFRDEAGNRVVFKGSANEGFGGLVANFETIDVFCSWKEKDTDRVTEAVDDFEALWANETRNLRVLEFPEAARERLLQYRPLLRPVSDPEKHLWEQAPNEPTRPASLTLRGYQKEAIRSWFRQDGQGIWEMATGTGKTVTTLSAIAALRDRLIKDHLPLTVVVVAPFKHLVDQWTDECNAFGITPIRCYESAARWTTELSVALASQRTGHGFVCAIATNSTFASDAFQDEVSRIRGPFLMIGDEVHNLGAPWLRTRFPSNATYRLGLSATPLRHRDSEGSIAILEYFGPIVFSYAIGEAIRDGYLTPYEYHPLPIELESDEYDEYLELSRKIGQLSASQSDGELSADDLSDGPLKAYLIKRARLLGGARGKLTMLRALLADRTDETHALVYCSDARVGGDGERQIDATTQLLGRDLGMRVSQYTHDTGLSDRNRLRRQLATGEIQALIAIRCLDEGVDIPEVRTGFILASSTNPRQFIQRRGRLLRLSEGKSKAVVYDFLAVPPLSEEVEPQVFEVERRLFRRELERVVEFTRTATNGPQALQSLRDLRRHYRLLDVG